MSTSNRSISKNAFKYDDSKDINRRFIKYLIFLNSCYL